MSQEEGAAAISAIRGQTNRAIPMDAIEEEEKEKISDFFAPKSAHDAVEEAN